jgi:hypothetical protein
MSQPVRPEPKYFLNERVSLDEYLSAVFGEAPSDVTYLGEKSTSYYEFPALAARIKSVLPEVRILVILRNPVQRALSNYQFSVQHGLETRTILEAFVEKIPPPPVPKNVSVDPFDYYGRGHYANHLLPFMEVFASRLHAMILEEVIEARQADALWDFLELPRIPVNNQRINASSNIQVPAEVSDALTAHYADEIARLERLLGRNLDIWRNQRPLHDSV